MTILDEIIAHKKAEISEKQKLFPISFIEKQKYFEMKTFSLKNELFKKDKVGIISEFKRKSPSKSEINRDAKIENVVKGYENAGASGISVLTDSDFFGGKNDDLITARELVNLPILRKDFIIDEYQVLEAKSIGADVILLIAAALNPSQLKQLALLAKSLKMEVLLEVHNKEELEISLNENIDIVGVNNRNLKTFEVNIENSLQLANAIPDDFLKISESGLEKPADLLRLKESGYNGFLIGETFMKEKDPGMTCADLISSLKEFCTLSGLNKITFRSATQADLPAIEKLAHKIWKGVYPAIISNSQIDYMLQKMYSLESLKKQISEKRHEFTLAFLSDEVLTKSDEKENLIGYLDTSTENGYDYFLHKLYVDTAFHGKGISTKLFDFVFSENEKTRSVRLQVNRQNKRAINFYNKLGFSIEYEKDFDIGEGFFMCDYVMVKIY